MNIITDDKSKFNLIITIPWILILFFFLISTLNQLSIVIIVNIGYKEWGFNVAIVYVVLIILIKEIFETLDKIIMVFKK